MRISLQQVRAKRVDHQPPCDTVTTATPPRPDRKRGPVAKRRFQKGCFQLKNGVAYCFYYEDCEQANGSLVTRQVRHLIGRVPDEMSERAARREHDRIIHEVNLKRGSVAPTVKGRTFGDAVEAWRKAIAPTLSPATARQMESHLRAHILPKFGEESTQALDVPALQLFATDLLSHLSQKTVVNVLSTLLSILKYAGKCRMPVANISLNDLRLGTVTARAERPYFRREQSEAIIEVADEPYKTMFRVLWLTGLRAGELLALKVSDLDFHKRTILVDESADDNTRELRQPKTRNSVGLLPMPNVLETALQNYLRHYWMPNAAGYLFPNRKGTHPRWRDNVVKYGLKPILRRLGIPDHNAGLHAFRHGLATELADRSVPLPVLQKQMRHADVRTTLRVYAHAIPDTQRSVMEALASSNQYTVTIDTNSEAQPITN